jgi:hypothetical protein
MRSLSALQSALLVAFFGSVLAVFIPHFVRDLRASRLAEPLDGLHRIAAAATMQAAGSPCEIAYPPTAPRTPAQVPAGNAEVDPPGTWGNESWRLLHFKKTEPHYYSFEFESLNNPTGAHFIARSFGDLDGDGNLSHFELYGDVAPGREPQVYSVRMHREVE